MLASSKWTVALVVTYLLALGSFWRLLPGGISLTELFPVRPTLGNDPNALVDLGTPAYIWLVAMFPTSFVVGLLLGSLRALWILGGVALLDSFLVLLAYNAHRPPPAAPSGEPQPDEWLLLAISIMDIHVVVPGVAMVVGVLVHKSALRRSSMS